MKKNRSLCPIFIIRDNAPKHQIHIKIKQGLSRMS